ncbi:MAG: hypothetical protein LBF50_05750, partial [Azoarcus sp.]|nr:hypothetical protein [Azoarcus sp.]
RRPETGDRRPETGDRRPETGDRRPETGDRRQESRQDHHPFLIEKCHAKAHGDEMEISASLYE